MLAHLYGIPAESARWRQIARERGIVVIDDAAQAVGATLGGRPVGSLGDLGVLSFGRGKGRTGGSGGALLSLTPAGIHLLDRVAGRALPGPSLGAQGSAAAKLLVQWLLGRPSIYGLPASIPRLGLGQTHFKAPRPVTRIGGLAAGVLLGAWEASAAEVLVRRSNAEEWMDAALGPGLRRMTIVGTAKPGWLRFPILVSPGRRSDFLSKSARRLGVAAAYPTTLAELVGFGDRILPGGDVAGAAALANALVTLPTHGLLSAADRRGLLRLLSD